MPLHEPQEDEAGVHSSKVVSVVIEPQEVPILVEEETSSSCFCAGPLSGVAEMFSLFYTVPGFGRMALFMFCQAGGQCLPAIFYLGPLISQVWGDNAAAYSNWSNAACFFFAMLLTPMFGMWSDGRPRKTSMIIVAIMTFLKFSVFIFIPLGLNKETGVWIWCIMIVVTGPFVTQLSGSPVLWAWMTDIIPSEHRETGFALVYAIGAFASWFLGTIMSLLQLPPAALMYFGEFLLFCAMMLIFTMPKAPMPSQAPDEAVVDPLAPKKSLANTLLSPFRLVARKRSLRLLCGLAAFITLPDIAVTYTAQPLVLSMMHIDGEGHVDEQAVVANWFSNFPNIFSIMILGIVGVCAKRFGPARTIMVWLPITSVLFAAPAILNKNSGPAELCLSGVLMLSPISLYPPLQALVALLVPPNRVGEAMGAVAACKNLASLIAPLIMGVVTQAMANNGRKDLYWLIFPGSALVMLVGAWPFAVMLSRRLAEGTDTDVKWSVWSSVSGSKAGGHQSLLASQARAVEYA